MKRLLLALVLAGAAVLHGQDRLAEAFDRPPPKAAPWVYWYWMYGAVSREGIAADLAAMKADGIQGAYLMPIKGPQDKQVYSPAANQLSPRWWDLMRYAFAQADRDGVSLALHVADGFAVAGGPWITPEESMQRVVWSQTQVWAGHPLEGPLAQPPTVRGYYRDIAVLAFPSQPGASPWPVPAVTSSLAGADAGALAVPGNAREFETDRPCWIQFAYPRPVTCRAVTVRTPPWVSYQANRLVLEVSEDGINFRSLGRLISPRHGWQDDDEPTTHAIVPTRARIFRFVYDPAGSEPGSEDLDSAKFGTALRVLEIRLSGEPRLDDFEGKNASIWRVSPPTSAGAVPDSECVPLGRIIDLTSRLGPDGRLDWTPPEGSWTVLRIGHTSTGHENETGGGGRGLECDKLSAAAARIQFDHWFGEAIRQVGPELAGRVLKVFHVDSWECGSQNWTGDFREEFRRRRGYDLGPYLPAMAGIPVGSAQVSERFLRDVRTTVDELLSERFFGTLSALAHAHGCVFSSECVAPTMVDDDLLHYRHTDVPMGEFWLRSPTHDKPNDILDAVSGAHIYGWPIAQAEAFTELRNRWDEAPGLLKPLADLNYCRGINRFVFHVFVENPWLDRRPGMTLNGVGTYFQRDQTWWKPGRVWFDYAARCEALLEQGRPLADIAVFTGEEEPRRAILPDRLGGVLPGILGGPVDSCDPLQGYAYDCINRDVLLRLARVRGGRIELPGGASYALLVIPGARPMNPDGTAMSPEVARKIDELVRAGATVIWQTKPTHAPGLTGYPACDAEVRDRAEEFWPDRSHSKSAAAGRILAGPFSAESFSSLGVARDFIAREPNGGRAADLAWTHRAGSGFDLYFVSNQLARPRVLDLSLRARGRPQLWDPVTGERTEALQWSVEGGRTVVPVRLAANGSLFVILRGSGSGGSDRGYNWPLAAPALAIGPPWVVSFDPASGGPAQPVRFEELQDWTSRPEPGIRYYSGTARYTCRFDWKPAPAGTGRVWLDLGRVADLAVVHLNGRLCGTAWTFPYRVEVTDALRSGGNILEVAVTNTWANRLVGDSLLPADQRRTWTLAPSPTAVLPAGLLGPVVLEAENPAAVSPARMEQVYAAARTPYKFGIVIHPQPGGLVDCPSVFRYRGRWYMLYVASHEKEGYETHLARSSDLRHWTPLGTVLPFSGSGWDRWQGDGGISLVDPAWGGPAEPERYEGRTWMSYIGGALPGYETDPLSIGIAWTAAPDQPRPWARYPGNPVLTPFQPDARPFEKKTLYKSQIIRDPRQSLGAPFVMFYNGKEGGRGAWTERIGMALSRDMLHWTRHGAGPVVDNGYGISGDPQIVRMNGLWVMFYFGAFWQSGAFDTFACSPDLVHWTCWYGPALVQPSEPWDRTFAHKPWLIESEGVVYHFYCAVGDQGRTIALATSRPLPP